MLELILNIKKIDLYINLYNIYIIQDDHTCKVFYVRKSYWQ